MHHHRQMTTRVACAQLPLSIGDTAGNRASCRSAVEVAARDGAQIVVLPELASSGYVFADRAELSSLAETRDGAGHRRMGQPRRARSGSPSSPDSPRRRATRSQQRGRRRPDGSARRVSQGAPVGQRERRVRPRRRSAHRGGHRTRPHRRDDLLRRRVPGMGSRRGAFRRRPAVRPGELATAAATEGNDRPRWCARWRVRG